MSEIIDLVFAKTSSKLSFSMTEYERFGLVFTKTRVYKFGQRCLVPEIIDTVFTKTSPIRSFSMTEYEPFGLVFTKTRVYKFGHRTQLTPQLKVLSNGNRDGVGAGELFLPCSVYSPNNRLVQCQNVLRTLNLYALLVMVAF